MRKARTRTLIQLGGLFEKAGLLKHFNIELGDDLQLDLNKKKQALSVLGALIEVEEKISRGDFHIGLWENMGARLFSKSIDNQNSPLKESKKPPSEDRVTA